MTETFATTVPARPSRGAGTWPTDTAWGLVGMLPGLGRVVGGAADACAAWLAALLASVVPVASEILDTPRWIAFVLVGLVLTAIGLARGRRATWPQAAAMAGFFGVATVALFLEPRLGLALAGLALAAHAG